MNDTKLTSRQLKILQNLLVSQPLARKDIENIFKKEVSKITAIRDLNSLIDLGYIYSVGEGPATEYKLKDEAHTLVPVDIDAYFSKNVDERVLSSDNFNSNVLTQLKNLMDDKELELFAKGKTLLKQKFEELDSTILKRELERFTIEFSWKSSQIEGNTYSLLETEELIKNKKEASGHSKEEAAMILDHKKAFDLILEKRDSFRDISLVDLRALHSVLVEGLGVTKNIREHAVGITGTKYRPLDNKWQIEEVLSKLFKVAKNVSAPEQAIIYLGMVSYIQPFADGNKRVARMLSNAVLLANGYFPLSYRSVDEVAYKKALIVFYELNSLYALKKIFIEQQKFAIENYFK